LAPVPNNFHDYDGMFILGRAIPFVLWLYGFLFISPIGTEMFYLCIRASEREREREGRSSLLWARAALSVARWTERESKMNSSIFCENEKALQRQTEEMKCRLKQRCVRL